MRDPKAIQKAIMTAKSIASLVDPKFARVPLPNLGSPAPEVYVPEHSPAMHEAFGLPMPKGYAAGGEIEALHFASGGEVLKAWRNPSPKALRNLTERSTHKAMRGLHHGNDQFWWDADHAIHHDAAQMLGIPYDYKNRMDARIDSVSGNYGIGADEGVPDHIVSHYERAANDRDDHYAAGGGVDDENLYAQPNEFGLYSHAAATAAGLPQERGTPEQFRGMLLKRGVKPTELSEAGYDTAFSDQPQITRQQLAEHFSGALPAFNQKTYRSGIAEEEMKELRRRQTEQVGAYQEKARRASQEGRPFDENGEIWKRMLEMNQFERRELERKQYDDPKYADWTLFGGRGGDEYDDESNRGNYSKNYREVLLKLPQHSGNYESSHWSGERNPLLHLRLSDRKDHEGANVLHMEELQSDWAQEGRKKGFDQSENDTYAKMKNATQALEDFYNHLADLEADRIMGHVKDPNSGLSPESRDQWLNDNDKDSLRAKMFDVVTAGGPFSARIHGLEDEYKRLVREAEESAHNHYAGIKEKKIPSAPYVTNTNDWVDLGLKQALYEAAAKGYDKLAWTPGDIHADRYDLSKHIGEIRHEKNDDGTYNLDVADKSGIRIFDVDDLPEDKLADHVGKEMAQKIVAGEGQKDEDPGYRDWRSLTGLDLKVGGEGMRHFYDKIVPTRVKELVKKHDPEAKLEWSHVQGDEWPYTISIGGEDGNYFLHGLDARERDPTRCILAKGFKTYGEADDARERFLKGYHTSLPAIRITPKMRESILKKGFPAYAQGGEVEGHEVTNPMSIFPKPQRMWDEDMPGGAYLSMPDKQDVTGHRASSASIGIGEGGKPYFNASRDPAEVTGSPGRGSATVKTNLFKQKAGWKWLDTPEGHDNTNTLVSVEHRGKHHYVLHAHFPKGVDLARYPDAPSEPRLRPTTKGNVELGPQVGSISVRGKEHPVHSHAIVKAYGGEIEGYADGGEIDPELFKQYMKRIHSPLSEDPESVRKALSIAGSYRAPTGMETGVGSLYSIKQSMPASAVTRTIQDIPGVKLKPKKQGSWEDFYDLAKGHEFVNVGGDLSGFGRLTHINGKELAWPVDLHAGADYMREPNPGRVWANIGAHATSYRNKIREANERGKELYGILSPMGASAVNSSHNMFDTLMAQIPNAGIDPDHLKEFDEAIKRGDHIKDLEKSKPKVFAEYLEKLKKWPGLENAKEVSDFARPENGNINGGHRTRIVQFMDQGRWRDRGFPEVGVTRAAITNPDLMGVGGNKLGFRVVKLSNTEPQGGKLLFQHSTYPVNTFGEYVMDVPLVQRHYAQPDVIERLVKTPTKSGQIVHPYSEDFLGRSTARKHFEEQKHIQPVTQRFIDSVMTGMENQSKYGFKKGGTVRKAMMIAKGGKKK